MEISLTSAGVTSADRVRQAYTELEERALAGIAPGSVKQARRVSATLGGGMSTFDELMSDVMAAAERFGHREHVQSGC